MKLFRLDRYELIGAAFAIGVVGPIAWMAMDQSPALKIVSIRSPTDPIDRLGTLRLDYRAVYLRANCSGEGRRKFVDISRRAIWTEPYDFRTGIGFDGKPVQIGRPMLLPPISITIPLTMAPGPATYQNEVRFYCNPLQKMLGRQWPWLSIASSSPSIDFIVAEAVAAHPQPSTHIFEPSPAADPPDDEGAQP